MDQRDRLVGILGVVAVILSAGLGTAFHTGPEGDDGGEGELYADWTQTGSKSITYSGLNSDIYDFSIPEHNVTSVSFRLTWTDDELVSPIGIRADLLTISVRGPSTLDEPTQTASGTSGELRVSYELAGVPFDPDPEAFALYDDTNATGEWEVTVTVEANGLRDTGNDWTLSVNYNYYVGRLLQVPGDE